MPFAITLTNLAAEDGPKPLGALRASLRGVDGCASADQRCCTQPSRDMRRGSDADASLRWDHQEQEMSFTDATTATLEVQGGVSQVIGGVPQKERVDAPSTSLAYSTT